MEMETSFTVSGEDENINEQQDNSVSKKTENINADLSIHVPSNQSSFHSVSDGDLSSDGTVVCNEIDDKHECMINDDQSVTSLDDLDTDFQLLNSQEKQCS